MRAMWRESRAQTPAQVTPSEEEETAALQRRGRAARRRARAPTPARKRRCGVA
ncbi:hypothetical protein ACP70R_015682 [Stipagrostis hirtigluma subsp. patula]